MLRQPYAHDCYNCIWVGWFFGGEQYANVYFCPSGGHGPSKGSVIIRYSDEPSDYWSAPVFHGSNPIALEDGEKVPDRQALARIHEVMDGREWNSNTLEQIALIVEATGRTIRNSDDFLDGGEDAT